MTPLVEEPLKLAAFIFAVYVVPTKSYKGLLLVAITAGQGFQISEDFSYILSDLPDGFLIQSQEFLVELLVLYRLTGFTHPSSLWG